MKEYSQTHVMFEQRRMVQLDGGTQEFYLKTLIGHFPYHQIENSKNHGKKSVKKLPRKYTKSVYYHCILLPHDCQIIILNQSQSTLHSELFFWSTGCQRTEEQRQLLTLGQYFDPVNESLTKFKIRILQSIL